jgi:predicted RNase H-like HicB family nuclease
MVQVVYRRGLFQVTKDESGYYWYDPTLTRVIVGTFETLDEALCNWQYMMDLHVAGTPTYITPQSIPRSTNVIHVDFVKKKRVS